jgi:hypothetical protein
MLPYGVFVFTTHCDFLSELSDKDKALIEINSIPELEGLHICVAGALPLTLLIQSP